MNTSNATAHQLLLTCFNQADYVTTEQHARELVTRFPNDGFAWKVLGVALRHQGQLAASLAPIKKAAELLPDDAEAHSNLGVTLMNQGQLAEAVISYRRALDLSPDYVDVHHHLGLTLTTLGQLAEAEACYQRVLALKPDYPDALYNLGRVFQEQGHLFEAEDYYRRVLAMHPELSDVHSHLAWVLHWQNRLSESESSYQHALAINPQDVKAHSHLGLMLHTQGRLHEAKQCYQNALAIQPEFAELHNNLGIVLHELGFDNEAEVSYQRALTLKPNFAEAYNNLGLSLQARGQLVEAEAAYRHTLTINPNYSEAHNNLGFIFQERGQLIEAQASYQRALAIKSNDAQVHHNLGIIYQDLGRLKAAEASFKKALAINPDYIEARSHLLLTMNDNAEHSAAECLIEARQYGLCVQVDTPFTEWQCDKQAERLRVGMVLGDLSQQSVGLFLASLLPAIDDSCIELFAYPIHAQSDELTAKIQPYFAKWQPLSPFNDTDAANVIHADGIHILLDLVGHSHHNRLPVFAWQAAPIQVNWLGSLGTSGLREINYVLGDAYTTPLADAESFSETIWQLPDAYRCFTVPDSSLKVTPLPALTGNSITFGSFNSLNQMNDEVVALWARILQAVPYAHLLLKTVQLNDALTCQITYQRFAEQGILPERLLLEGVSESEPLLAAYARVDIALDTFPYGGTTSVEALWMAVPVITRQGNKLIARGGESLLSTIGLANWIAEDDDHYVAKAVYFAWDIAHLAELRTQLRQQVLDSPLFDVVSFARNFEAALWSMQQT